MPPPAAMKPAPPPKRLSLSRLLIAVNAGLVLLAVVWVVIAAVGRLRRLGDDQALAHVMLGGSTALQAVSHAGEETLTAARLLAERPTLLRLVEARDAAGLATFLERFRAAGRLSGCAVIQDGAVLAAAGLPAALPPPGAPPSGVCEVSARRPQTGGPLRLSAVCPARAARPATVVTTLALDGEAVDRIARQVGMLVAVLDRDAALRDPDDPRYDARARALEGEDPGPRRLEPPGLYVTVLPLRAASGEILGVVETSMPTTAIVASLRGLVRSLVTVSAVVAVIVTALSVLVARWLALPLESLTRASARIGAGDLSTPIPYAPGAEAGTLADSMEEMRRRLLQLTDELRRRQGEAEAVITGIAEGVFSVDRERRIRYLNPQAARLLGIDAAGAAGRFCGDVLNPQGPGGQRPCEANCPIVHARFGGQARSTEHLLLPGGRRLTVVITSATSDRAGGAPAEYPEDAPQFQVIRDETEVETTRRLRDVVLSNISHEFRTPLTAQLASIELLRERLGGAGGGGGAGAGEAEMLVLSLQRGTLRLTQLIDNLLESVRLEAGQRSIRRRPVALDEVLEEAVELTAPLIAHRGQTLSIDLPYPIPAITGDAARLTQVFVNLLANANKFAPEGSTIRIGGTVDGTEVAVWVEDEGPGLRPSALSGLFERFVRTPAGPPGGAGAAAAPDAPAEEDEPEQSGMGLGLSIVKSIVDRHGGRIEVRGGEPGRPGTRMCVILPQERGHEDSGG